MAVHKLTEASTPIAQREPPHSPHVSTPNFKLHPSALRYALPLSKFARLPSNADKELWVGLIIVGKGNLAQAEAGQAEHIPTALLVKPAPAHGPVSSPLSPLTQGDPVQIDVYDLPSVAARFGTDQTLLETVIRCAVECTGKGVKEISRFLGSAVYTVPTVAAVSGSPFAPLYGSGGEGGGQDGKEGKEENNGRKARRCDFLVKLHPGPITLPEGAQGKWLDTDESWRVMKRLPAGQGM